MDSIHSFWQFAAVVIGFAGGIACLVFLARLALQWAENRGLILLRRDTSTWGSAGYAMLEVQKILEPDKAYILEAKREKEDVREQDDSGGPDAAGRP